MLFTKFKKYVDELGILKGGDSVVVAVSGGVDSMVLFDLVRRLAGERELKVAISHINHMLRGKDSDLDEKLVRKTAEKFMVPCEVLRKKPPTGKNLQNAARDLRYEFLEKVAVQRGDETILTAHHRDDQAETVILHLVRGSGAGGLCGMKPVLKTKSGIRIARPMLFAPKREIEKYAAGRGIKFRVDSTNKTKKYRRNEIRHVLIPILKKINPRVVDAIALTAERIFRDHEALEILSREAFSLSLLKADKNSVEFKREEYIHFPKAIRGRILRIAYEKAAGSIADLNADQLEKMDGISLGQKIAGSYRLKAPWKFIRSGGVLAIVRSRTKHDRAENLLRHFVL